MRTIVHGLSFGVLVSLVACGGSVAKLGGGDGGNQDGGGDCPSETVVGQGASCSTNGQTCTGIVSYSQCGGPPTSTPAQCTCENGGWQCPVEFSGGCVGPEVCPSPPSVTPGASCSLPSGMTCASDIPILACDGVTVTGYQQCNCESGQWLCGPVGTPVCPVDASVPCPDPTTVFVGDGCSTPPGTICSGDPQTCGGATLYDALQCTNGAWQIAAATVCDVDAGIGD
jgi:hypothetical protein